MKARLVNYLVCPECKTSLDISVYQEDTTLPWVEYLEGRLTCRACPREFPLQEGVPRMLTGRLSGEVRSTVEGFGWEWLNFNNQIQDTFMTDKANFLDFIHPTTEEFFEGKVVLDAGCGMGRFLKLGAEFGSKEIIGVDLSSAVEAAYRNTRHLPNAHVVQADILALPFIDQFDYIFSIGVLHHMPDPKEGFCHLVRFLNATGRISVWVYSQENNRWVIRLAPFRKHLTSRLPKSLLNGLSQLLGLFLYSWLKLVSKPINESTLGQKFKNLLPYNEYLYYYSSRLSYISVVSIVFDHLVPQLAAYISKEEIEGWFREANLSSVAITSRNNMSWRGHGTRVVHFEST